jgi:hypothetical protein
MGEEDYRQHGDRISLLLFFQNKESRLVIILLMWVHSMEDEMGRTCNTHGKKRNAYRILVGTP